MHPLYWMLVAWLRPLACACTFANYRLLEPCDRHNHPYHHVTGVTAMERVIRDLVWISALLGMTIIICTAVVLTKSGALG